MNSQKAILYISIMLIIPFIGGYIISNFFLDAQESIAMSALGTLYVNGQIFILGLIIEGIKYFRGRYKESEKVFWHEWAETTFSIWIVLFLIIVTVQTFIRLR